MSAQNPGDKFICQAKKHSWIFNYDRGFDYLTQLPTDAQSAGKMMFGGGYAQGKAGGITDLGISTDSELSLYCDIHLSGALSAIFGRENWGHVPGSETMMWTGNMGFSADGLPWVGRLPSSEGLSHGAANEGGAQWACCGFSGEGMVSAWLCGKAIAKMVSMHDRGHSGSGELSWFPKQMLVTEERIRSSVLPRSVIDKTSHV
jgi:glycine/D-amino acid oxidase-like deaminating enzyme